MSTPNELFFEVHQGGNYVRTESFAQEVIKIGSHPKSHIFVEDEGVSRVHAMVEVGADGAHIIDLGSGRGTYVNGDKVNKRRLEHRDRITVGSTDIVFMTVDERALAAAAAAKAKSAELPRDAVVYARRFLARPSNTDGTVEVAMLYNDFVMREDLFQAPATVTLGSGHACTYRYEHDSLPADGVTLLEITSQGAFLSVSPQFAGDIYIGTERYPISRAESVPGASRAGGNVRIPFNASTRAKIVVGDLVFFVRHTRKPLVVMPWAMQDTGLPFHVASAILHALVLAALLFGASVSDIRGDSFALNDRLVNLIIEDQIPEEPEIEPEEAEDEGEEPEPEDNGEAIAGEEGRAGTEEAEPEEEVRRMAIEGTATTPEEVELARAEARENVQNRGLLQVMNGPTSAFGSTMPNGMDAVTAIGAINGSSTGASWGSSGLGAYGGGLGGGGRSMRGGFNGGPIAIARNSRATQNAAVAAVTNINQRTAATPTVGIDGSADVEGQLDREIIQRVVRENRRGIRACYESALQRNQNLEGRVTVRWVISPDGAVAGASVQTSTMNSQEVENCLVSRVRQFRFPEPRGGGIVRVNFPFDFAPGG
jgi:TonB family protein